MLAPIIDLNGLNHSKIIEKIVNLNLDPKKDQRIVNFFNPTGIKYTKNTKISTICNKLTLPQLKAFYTVLTKNGDQTSSSTDKLDSTTNSTDLINKKEPEVDNKDLKVDNIEQKNDNKEQKLIMKNLI